MIDIRDYDLALVERIKAFFQNTHFIMRPTIPIKEIRDRKVLNGEDIDFPLITVRRTNCPIFSKEYNSWSRAKSGQTFYTAGTNGTGDLTKLDPELAAKIKSTGHNDALSVVNSTFDLTYYIDVISLERDNFDTLMVELQENLFTVPYIGFFNIKSDGTKDKVITDQACHLLVEEVEDTSNLESFDSGSALYRATVTVKINAYIYRKFRSKAVESFKLKFDKDESSISNDDANNNKSIISDLSNLLNVTDNSNSLEELSDTLGFDSPEDFGAWLFKKQQTDARYKIGPDMITLIFQIPHVNANSEVIDNGD